MTIIKFGEYPLTPRKALLLVEPLHPNQEVAQIHAWHSQPFRAILLELFRRGICPTILTIPAASLRRFRYNFQRSQSLEERDNGHSLAQIKLKRVCLFDCPNKPYRLLGICVLFSHFTGRQGILAMIFMQSQVFISWPLVLGCCRYFRLRSRASIK